MGCAASRKLYDETRIDVAKPEAFPVARGSQRLKQANKYALPQSLNQMAGYDICDADGKVRPRDLILRCHHGHTSFSIAPLLARQVRFKIKYISLTDQKVLTDASGKKVFMIRGKVLTSLKSLYFFTYSPNFAGQTPTEHDGYAPLYKFALMRTNGWGCAPRWEYLLFTKSNDDFEKVAEVAAVCNLVYSAGTMTDLKGEPLMKMTQNSRTTDVEVAAGMDPIQAIAICIAAQMLQSDAFDADVPIGGF